MRVRLKHQKLADLIAASPFTQNHWALKLGLSRGHWSDLVNGNHPFPSAKTRTLILEAFDVPLDILFEVDSGDDAWADIDFRRAIASRYIIDSEVGQGGMGAVYLARDIKLGRLVAIKVIAAEAVSGIGLNQFQRETSTLAQLLHANIIPLYEAGDVAGQPYFVMPYVRTGSLRALLKRETRLPVANALPLIRGIASALHYAHRERVLHCDVKPENILLIGDYVWVTDFGIARRLRSESDAWPNRHGIDSSAGTPAYVSPEQASGGIELDARSDVYSVGCVVYEMLSGRSPFTGANTQQIVSSRFVAPPPDIRSIAPDVPSPVADVIHRAMSLRREDRQATAADFSREIIEAAHLSTSVVARARYAMWRGVAAAQRTLKVTPDDKGGMFIRRTLGSLTQDIRFGARMLLKNRAFAAIAILTLALGIGANTAMFSVVNAVLLRPLPFQAPERLVAIGQTDADNRTDLAQFSFRNFDDFRSSTKSLERVAAYYTSNATLTGQGAAVRMRGAVVTSDLFPLLGATPVLGRSFSARDDIAGGGPDGHAAILGWQAWQQRFGSDSTIVGRSITLSGRAYTVVGVMPPSFSFPVQTPPIEYWVTPAYDAEVTGEGAMMVSRGYHGWRAVGRLKQGASLEQLLSESKGVAASLAQQFPEANKDMGINAIPLRDYLVGNVRLTLLLLLGTVGVVLLIACTNVAHLLLERGVSRQREVTVRLALGATRWRIARQQITEILMLTFAGGALGVAMAIAGTSLLVSRSPGGIARITEATIDSRVLVFTMLVSVVTGVVFGLIPALGVSRVAVASAIKEGGRNTRGARAGRMHGALIIAEVSLSLVLLIGAGLLVRSLQRLHNVPVGFDPTNVLTMSVTKTAEDPAVTAEFYRELTERVRALPGVANASVTWQLPLSGAGASTGLNIEGQNNDAPNPPMGVIHSASPGFFATMRIPVVAGRDFSDADNAQSEPVIIINQTLAKKFFPAGDALGKHVMPGFATSGSVRQRTVVGVVGDVKHSGLRSGTTYEFYFPQAQMPYGGMTLVVRTVVNPRSLIEPIRKTVQSMDANAPVYSVLTADDYLSRSVASTRFNMTLLATFAAIALIMTAVGLYGVISFSVAQSTRDIGIRVALGARARDTVGMIVGRGVGLAGIGVAVGLVAAMALSRVMNSLLFGVGSTDLATFTTVSVLLIGVAAVAAYVPARRAARVDPMVALRS